MNSRERVHLALTGQTPDRIPVALAFFPQSLPALGIADADAYFDADVRFVEFSPPREQDDFLRYLRRLPPDVHVGDLRQLRTYHEWDYHPEAGPYGPLGVVEKAADVQAHPFPALSDPARYRGLTDQVLRLHERGYAAAGAPPHLGGELFETAYRLRGFDNFMIDLVERPALADYLLDQLTAIARNSAVVLARAGVDILVLDDDVAMPTGLLLSPAVWGRFFRPRMAEIIRAAREAASDLLVLYHSDGDFTALVPDLMEIGVNAINPVQPDCIDAAALRRRFGPGPAFWGTVGSATLWDAGSPDAIRRDVRDRIATLGPAGLLLCPAYDVDFTPLQNLEAFFDAARQYGTLSA